MEYQFIHTIHGPAVMGEDEVVYFSQIAQLEDYATEDPEFFVKAFDFIKEQFSYLSSLFITSLTEPVVGHEQIYGLHMYVHAADQIRRFESQFRQVPHQH